MKFLENIVKPKCVCVCVSTTWFQVLKDWLHRCTNNSKCDAAKWIRPSQDTSLGRVPVKFNSQFYDSLTYDLTSHLYGTAFTTVPVTVFSEAAIFTSSKIGWWSFPFCYVAKMVTTEREKCPAFHTELFDHLGTPQSALHVAILVSQNAFMHLK